MGMSAHAHLAWGVDLGEGDCMDPDLSDKIGGLLEDDWELEKFFGFTEPRPWDSGEHPRWDELSREERKPILDAYEARKDAAIPVEFDTYGHCDYGVRCLIVKRTLHTAYWGLSVIDNPAMVGPPIPDGAETAALNKVLDAIGFEGDRTINLLLFAYYG